MRLERGQQEEQKEEEERSGEDVVPGDSVSNQGEGAVEEGTDDKWVIPESMLDGPSPMHRGLYQIGLQVAAKTIQTFHI